MNKRQHKKYVLRQLKLNPNDICVIEFDINKVKLDMTEKIAKMIYNKLQNKVIAVPNETTLKSMNKKQIQSVIDMLNKIVGD